MLRFFLALIATSAVAIPPVPDLNPTPVFSYPTANIFIGWELPKEPLSVVGCKVICGNQPGRYYKKAFSSNTTWITASNLNTTLPWFFRIAIICSNSVGVVYTCSTTLTNGDTGEITTNAVQYTNYDVLSPYSQELAYIDSNVIPFLCFSNGLPTYVWYGKTNRTYFVLSGTLPSSITNLEQKFSGINGVMSFIDTNPNIQMKFYNLKAQ